MVSRRLRDDTSDLVLDGRLMGEAREELNIQELLKHAVATLDGGGTVPEASLVARWPALREELRAAQRAWDAGTIGTTARLTTAASFRFPAEAGPGACGPPRAGVAAQAASGAVLPPVKKRSASSEQ